MADLQQTQQNQGIPDWLSQMLGIGGGLGVAGGGIYNMFGGGGKNPADAGNKYISQIPGQTKQYYDPYMQAGKGAMGDLQNQYKDLLWSGWQCCCRWWFSRYAYASR